MANERLGQYEVLTRLSVGGMAEIFLAADSVPGGQRRLVILKRILPQLREREEFVHMFMDEARISALLSHPNIAKVYELANEGQSLFIAMEFVAGQSLASILRRVHKLGRPVPVGFTALIGAQLCRALEAAHALKGPGGDATPVIHRDVSPTNVMVTYGGEVKVIDFGVAKAAGSLSRTMTGNIKGSRGYLSPEQARGAPLDARSDIFSAGIVMHELLTGHPLFLRDSELMTFRGILRDDIPSPLDANPMLPPKISEVVMKALQRHREHRFATAKEMERAITQALPGLMFTEAEGAALMRELFAAELRDTEALVAAEVSRRPLDSAAKRVGELGVPANQGTDVFGPVPTGVMRIVPAQVPASLRPPEKPLPQPGREAVVEGATVLSVDDSEISRDFIEAHLESAGFPVLHCGSPEEALDFIVERVPDLILLDVVMPRMNGFQLCRKLRELCVARPFLPIVFLTTASSFDMRLEALSAGGDDVIAKPYDPVQLVELVRAHLKRAALLERMSLAR
jgi:serine/threonine-protein kinase